MQLVLSFSTLLASLLLAITLVSDVDARPYKRDGGMVTFPVKRITQRSDIHPQVLLQQHINRGAKRFARMSGRSVPTDVELREKLHKRMFIPPGGRIPGPPEKRYNRQGVKPISDAVSSVKPLDTAFEGGNGKNAAQGEGHRHSIGGQVPAGAGSGTAVPVGATATETAAAAGASVSSDTSDGISQIDINDAASGGLTVANDPTASNSLGLDIEANDVGYIATVQIGTPPQNFKILMDSGSADFWVGSENCQSQGGGGCGNHTFLGTASSSSFVDKGTPFSVTYGSGEVSGDIVTDDVSIAGLSLQTHTFGVANEESVDFSSDSIPFDGLMGLAQSLLSEQKTATPVESLAQQKLIGSTVTSFKLGRVADGTNDGEITFGGLDPTNGFWEGAMDSVTVNGQDLGLSGRTAILDTGTTLIIAPTSDANAVHAAIPGAQSDGQGGFTIPCTTSASVALSFGGTSFAIDPRDLLFAPVDATDPTGDCVSGISSGQIGGATEWLVGDVFLKNAYFSTDEDNNAISLATLA
ncbi:hypothetical protein EW145_g6119 [Phellinidium pouzarii]|uniref:Peptidase A1 domain-containing protein n=1 Tax=Phellinidium pouzarii TaxID=167371 RepID=A0A4S4KXT0_9AGAM|nr:hypothetical protein EW145_g6119 [Phellinidium pouzarii]